SPTAVARADRACGTRPSSASGSALSSARQRLADKRQAIIAEIHVGLVEEYCGRAEAATRHHLVGVGLELILDRLLRNAGKEFFRIDAHAAANFGQDRVLRNVLILAPIDFED